MDCASSLYNTHHAAGVTFDQIAQAIGRDEVWVAAMFYGQVTTL